MAYREVCVIEVREVLRGWLAGAGLRTVAGFDAGEAPLLTRLAQGPLDAETGQVGDPLGTSA